ncbi:ribonuclease-like [Emydura macquarii macquarii]|uniref:ribonuclease-like n=1 Tax=Emydura macquarii macquarii TaxID=1129001 RepID=UPI00352B1FA5
MAWRGPHPMLLLVLLATWLSLAWGETRFGKFKRQHVADPRPDYQNNRYLNNSTYCNDMMQRQSMTSPVCKFTNTFIHVDNVNPVTDVCGSRGTPAHGNLRDSNARFPLTTCKHQGKTQRPPCKYSETTSTQRIRIACDKEGDPVHYEKSIQSVPGA